VFSRTFARALLANLRRVIRNNGRETCVKLRNLGWLGLVALVVAVPAAVAAAQTTTTTGTGIDVPLNKATLDCEPGQEDDLNPGPGQESFLFILTSPAGSSSTLTVETSGGDIVVQGVQQGNGSIHFVVTVPAGTEIIDATATGGTEESNLNISHCELGPTPTTTTVAAATTTTVKSAAPAAVTVTPRLTG
jgi:hypothetical protein